MAYPRAGIGSRSYEKAVTVWCSDDPNQAMTDAKAGLEMGEPLIRNFEPSEYNGHVQIWTIAEDHRGVMYFGTWQGLLEFDGTNWRKIQMPGASTARSLMVDASGRILLSSSADGTLRFWSVAASRELATIDTTQPVVATQLDNDNLGLVAVKQAWQAGKTTLCRITTDARVEDFVIVPIFF